MLLTKIINIILERWNTASNAEHVQLISNTMSSKYSRPTDTIEALYISIRNIFKGLKRFKHVYLKCKKY